MCFSAAASFLTAAVTAATGAAAVRRTRQASELPLAAMPIIFAVQQATEGALWLMLPSGAGSATCAALTDTFLAFAYLIWPVFTPFACWCVEHDARRRVMLSACFVIGAGVSLYLTSVLMAGTHQALLMDRHIVYDTVPPPDGRIGIPYLIATALAPALSSHRALNLLAIILVAGSVISWLAYWQAYVSVWCFFAAAASVVILIHFQRVRAAATVNR